MAAQNQVDAELMLSLLREEGFELTSDAGLADVVIVNTCGFIETQKNRLKIYWSSAR
ncbi:MAG: hypothetical protein ACLSAP_04010 [Oscillospiraceae bacterium]